MRLTHRHRQWIQRVAIAAGLSLGALLLQWSLRTLIDDRIPFLFFLPSLVLAAALAGRGAGLLVLLVGLANAAQWLPPTDSLAVAAPEDQLALLVYLAFGTLLVQLGARMQRNSARAVAAEERLMLVLEDTAIGIFDIDLSARMVQVSPSLARLAGLPVRSGPIPLAEWLARLPPAAVAESRAVLRDKLASRAASYERELQFTAADGRPFWLLLRVHVDWKDGRATHLRGAGVDITERKRVNAQLERTQAELQQQLDDLHGLQELGSRLLEPASLRAQLQMILRTLAASHGSERGIVSLLDADSGRLEVQASLGFPRATLERLDALRGGEGGTEGSRGLKEAQRQRLVIADIETDPRCAAYRELARQAGVRAVHSTPLISQSGAVLGAIAIHFDAPRRPTEREEALADICARKAAVFVERARAQSALEETRGRFEAVLEASAVPFALLAPLRNEAGRVIDFSFSYLNGAAARLMHRPAHRLLGQRVREALPLAGPSETVVFEHYVAVLEQREPREFEGRLAATGADPSVFHCIASPMRDSIALWCADISDRKRDEQLLHEADRRKDEFLATLAHELRNPLAPIRQAAVLSKSPGATEAQKRWSHEVIDRQVQHMALLLDDLLDISRITRGVLSLRKGPTELAAVVDAAVETARPLLDARRHALRVDLPAAPVSFEADALRIAQVIANLLTNAAKYTDCGGDIRLHAEADDDEVRITVSDNGIGIAAESLGEVFAMFTQLRTGDERDERGGLGIGLALTRGLVELHGGSITAQSKGANLGSRFSVRLPRRAVAMLEAPAAPAPALAAAPPHAVAPGCRILLADDNRDAAESLAMLLELQGHEVRLAFDGRDAIAAFERDPVDVCLLDIGMPGCDGNEVARTIRALPGGPRPMLIAITGWGQESDRRKAIEAGFDHHLTKPIDPDRLARLLEDQAARSTASA